MKVLKTAESSPAAEGRRSAVNAISEQKSPVASLGVSTASDRLDWTVRTDSATLCRPSALARAALRC